MSDRSERPILRALLIGAGASVLLVVLGTVWLVTRPAEAKVCTLAAPIDEVGAATPEEARERWARQFDLEAELGIDLDRPDEIDRSDDRETAVYILDRPDDPTRTHQKEIVVEVGDDDVWRVTEAPSCEVWTE